MQLIVQTELEIIKTKSHEEMNAKTVCHVCD